jgi:hypothetical protein
MRSTLGLQWEDRRYGRRHRTLTPRGGLTLGPSCQVIQHDPVAGGEANPVARTTLPFDLAVLEYWVASLTFSGGKVVSVAVLSLPWVGGLGLRPSTHPGNGLGLTKGVKGVHAVVPADSTQLGAAHSSANVTTRRIPTDVARLQTVRHAYSAGHI